MKNLATILLFTLLTVSLFSQAPALIPYQAIARDAVGQPLANTAINARFTIHDNSATGTSVWQEIQTVNTNTLGLFTAQLGSSIALSVNWGSGAKFMQVEIDLGNGFIDMGTQQMLSVPYALHSGSSAIASNGFSNISATGDTLFLTNGSYIIVPGISEANNNGGGTSIGSTLHTCGAANVHNPNLTYGSMADQEGNTYKTIVIGTQEWMAENLNTSIYRNGDAIPTGLSNSQWSSTTQGAWAYYNNDASYVCPYGKLYNWYAYVDARGLCPTGWHVPSDGEWNLLVKYLDPGADTTCDGCAQSTIAGAIMKSAGTIEGGDGYWLYWNPSVEGTNSSGFSALPGGYRYTAGDYINMGYVGYWWSSTQFDSDNPWYRSLGSSTTGVYRINSNATTQVGCGVRCLRD
jgi:uncharacterized protein (TIGR02145 family)